MWVEGVVGGGIEGERGEPREGSVWWRRPRIGSRMGERGWAKGRGGGGHSHRSCATTHDRVKILVKISVKILVKISVKI